MKEEFHFQLVIVNFNRKISGILTRKSDQLISYEMPFPMEKDYFEVQIFFIDNAIKPFFLYF